MAGSGAPGAKVAWMWFRRRRRRSPPSELQPSLDRLGELVARVVDLLDDGKPAEPRPPLPHVVVKVEPEAPVAPPAPHGARPQARSGAGTEVGGCRVDRLPAVAERLPARRPDRGAARARRVDHDRGNRLSGAQARPVAAAGGRAPLCLPRRGGTSGGGANLRRVKEESHIEDMRAAVRGDRERAEQARQRSSENVRALVEATPPEPAAEPAPAPERRSGLLARLLGR